MKLLFVFASLSPLMLLLPSFADALVGSSVVCRRQPFSRDGCSSSLVTTMMSAGSFERQGLLRGVDTAVDGFYASEIDTSREGLAWLDQSGLMWEAATKDAAAKGVSADEYIEGIEANITSFRISGMIHDRQELLRHLTKAFTVKGDFTLLLGGKSVGKSTVLQRLSKLHNLSKNLLVLYVDARLYPGRLEYGLANELAQLAAGPLFRSLGTDDLVAALKKGINLGRKASINRVLSACGVEDEESKKAIEDASNFIFDTVLNPMFGDKSKVCQSQLDMFIKMAKERNSFPVLVIDEANVVLGIEINGDQDVQTKNILINIVSYTKQAIKLNVIMASSEYAYPYTLEREGLSLQDVSMVIFAGEIPPNEMWKLLVNATYKEGIDKGQTIIGMGPHLADLCLAAYGGHFLRVKSAIQGLSLGQDEVEASQFLPKLTSNIIKCLDTYPKSRPLLEAMAKYGFAPIATPNDPAVEMIAKENIGGVVKKTNAACIGISKAKWKGTAFEYALIPSSESVRLGIAQDLLTRLDGSLILENQLDTSSTEKRKVLDMNIKSLDEEIKTLYCEAKLALDVGDVDGKKDTMKQIAAAKEKRKSLKDELEG